MVKRISLEGSRGVYDIYFVGFPHDGSHILERNVWSQKIDLSHWLHLAPDLAPEANIFDFELFSNNVAAVGDQASLPGNESFIPDKTTLQADAEFNDAGIATDSRSLNGVRPPLVPVLGGKSYSAQGLQDEARLLLNIAKDSDPTSTQSEWRPIIFIGYQLGGLIVQQAMVISNIEPKYYDIALRTHKLVLVATPHYEFSLETWETILDDMIVSSGSTIEGRKSAVLAEMALSINSMVAYFQGVLNYDTTYLLDNVAPPSRTLLMKGPPAPSQPATRCSSRIEANPRSQNDQIFVSDLRGLLFLDTLLGDYILDTEQPDTRLFYSDLLDFFQLLSPTSQLIYHRADSYVSGRDLALGLSTQHTTDVLLKHRYIQVIGPAGYGKATLVEHIVHKITHCPQKIILLNVLFEPFQQAQPDFLGLLRSLIHQLISQRPGLFSQIWPLYLEHYKPDMVARVNILSEFLRILLQASQGWKIVLAVTNIHLGLEAAQSSLDKLEELLKSSKCDYLIILSSTLEIPRYNLNSACLVLDLERENVHRGSYIQTMVTEVLSGQLILKKSELPERLHTLQIPELVSIAHARRYAMLLSRYCLLSTVDAVDAALRDCPRTESGIFNYCIQSLDSKIFHPCAMMISWVQKATRPLRTEELAVAIAVSDNESLEMAKFPTRISRSLDMEIRRYLDLVLRIENNLVFFHSANTRELLSEKSPDATRDKELQLLSHGQIACFCLRYITEILSRVSESAYEAQITWRGQLRGQQGLAELQLLDYAVQHWSTHYRTHVQLNSEPKSYPPQESGTRLDWVDTEVLRFLNPDSNIRNRWYRLYHAKTSSANKDIYDVGALEVATELGFTSLVSLLLSNATSEIPAPPQLASPPLDLGILLGVAVRHDHLELVEIFVEKGARRDTAFLEAAGLGKIDYLEKLFSSELLQSMNGHFIDHCLHQAARGGSLGSMEFCGKIITDWGWRDEGGFSVLHAAAIGGKVEILEYIKEGRTLNINSQDNTGISPLMIATRLNHTPFVEALCNMGADATLSNKDGKTALHLAIMADPKIVTLLLQYGASPVKPDKEGQTPLHHGCSLGKYNIVSQLVNALKKDESIDAQNEDSKTALDIAAARGDRALVRLLLGWYDGASVLRDKGQKAIKFAIAGAHFDVIEEFCSPLGMDELTRNALIIQSVSIGQPFILRFLLNDAKGLDFCVEKKSPLGVAAARGYIEIMRLLLQHEANPNFRDEYRFTPLHHAVIGGQVSAAAMLLEFKASPDYSGRYSWTPLHYAASRNMVEMVELLLKNGAGVDEQTNTNETAIHLSVSYPKVVETLLRYDPKLGLLTYSGKTPLHLAVAGRYLCTAEQLVKKDSKLVHILDEEDTTPLHTSIQANLDDMAIFELLYREEGLDSSQLCYERKPPILYALEYANLNVVRFLLERTPEMATSKYPGGVSTLHIAAQKGCVEILAELLDASKDLDVNGRTDAGETPLHYAVNDRAINEPNDQVVRQLIALGAVVDAVDELGETPLRKAAFHQRENIVVYLLKSNADPNFRDARNWTPLHAGADSAPVLQELLTHGAEIEYVVEADGWTALMRAVFWESPPAVRELLQRHANTEATDKQGRTALHLAAEKGDPILGRNLLEAGANISVVDTRGQTPLHYATMYNEGNFGVDKVKLFVEYGAAVGSADREGNTPLHYAVTREPSCSRPLIEALLEACRQKGLSIDEKNNHQHTPLQTALVLGSYDSCEVLIDQGASISQRDSKGNSCLALALLGPEKEQKVGCLLKAKSNYGQSPPPWDLDDSAASFLAALKIDMDIACILAQHDPRIFELQNDTFTVLQLCLDTGRFHEAESFLQLGANPFDHRIGRPSAFQSANATGERDRFFAACLEKLNEDNPYQHGLFQAVKMAIEERSPNLLARFGKWNSKFTDRDIADQDGWTVSHLASNNPRDFNDSIVVSRIKAMPLSAAELIIPEHWSMKEDIRKVCTLSSQDNTVEYLPSLKSSFRTSLRADHPFPPRGLGRAHYYFEVEILGNKGTTEESAVVAIGLCAEFVDMGDQFPGQWEHRPSLGYHGNNGRMYDFARTYSASTNRPFAEGDTVGCGIDWDHSRIYYTCNGDRVGEINGNNHSSSEIIPDGKHEGAAMHYKSELWEEAF
ncbi:hypothetical protein O1611_g1666 [Lasiodiplodia mahajangana]|uniref:Uncharacterized protein n=1 Tax=Lasiodiplodia mahajangana TaxID=1108764 RepID=A0ACC2JWQ6_9PEZI|nr:hypothetical protein O1611_g1666 [Lasiodiplodia mahajangana]